MLPEVEVIHAVRLPLQRVLRHAEQVVRSAWLGPDQLSEATAGSIYRDLFSLDVAPAARELRVRTRQQLLRLRHAEALSRGVAVAEVPTWIDDDEGVSDE